MRSWGPDELARRARAKVIAAPNARSGPRAVTIDSRTVETGDLFVGLSGDRVNGGVFAEDALSAGAWGVLVENRYAEAARQGAGEDQVILAAADPVLALQGLARSWRRHLAPKLVGVTGSTGKTSTKELLKGLVAAHRRTVASRGNFNTEIGLPLEMCNAPEGTEVLILEMGMRGPGQIAELTEIAEPDVGVIVSVGPVHLELLGSIEAIAAAKAELIASLQPGGTAIIPVDEPLLTPHLRCDVEIITFGDGGDVCTLSEDDEHMEIDARGEQILLEVPFIQRHLRRNLLAAVAAAHAVGVSASGRVAYEVGPGRGRRITAPNGITVIDDCYNANPMSMRAALEDLARVQGVSGRRVAVLGDMLELGPDARHFHEEVGEVANQTEIDLLITVGPLASSIADTFEAGVSYLAGDAEEAAALAQELLEPGDTVLVKASNGIGLSAVVDRLTAGIAT